ncbi:hypothetical protein OOJ91_12260 [Micromonospora lupini]|uniref:phage major capsid protein n=1 Tax=Micromonospora lupini TaxID=285679 RepID=UPI00225C17C0|nr:hypothetical protein [Micromonospora lupini]MCX5066652.1 hypothetical protein [Micromonospora lupini]
MPGAYPPAAPTLAGDLLTVHRLLQNPTYLKRRLRTIAELRFVADRILTGRYRTTGGAIAFEQSEPIMNTRPVESVAPGSEYPRDSTPEGTAALAAVSKWGQAVGLTDEKLKRSVYMGQEVNRALIKTANSVIQKVDRLATAAVASAVTSSIAAAANWNAATPALFRDVELAAAKVVDLNQGYNPRAVLMSTTKYALLITDPAIAALRRRETSDNPIYGGDIETLGKYRIIATPASNLPSDDVWVFDPDQLGGMADETEVDPGYATMDNGLQYKTKRIDERDSWDIWARRITVPVVQEPGAAIRLTGTGTLG